MSSEITPSTEGNASSSTSEARHSCAARPWDMFNPRAAFNDEISAHLIGGDYHTKQYLASEKGHQYVKQFNPTLESVKPLLDTIKEPSVLLLRGCDTLLLQSPGFPFHKFRSITALEISSCRHLTTIPENALSQMTQLQRLDLSYLPINQFPLAEFAITLRSLVLRGCTNLHVLPEPSSPLEMLEYLDLSYLPIETLHYNFTPDQLRSLILRGCSKLLSIRAIPERLQFLDLCHCTSLTEHQVSISSTIQVLDFSYTTCNWPHFPKYVSHLFGRNTELRKLGGINDYLDSLKVCDLSGNQGLEDISLLGTCGGLEALNLSKTSIESIDFLSGLTSLHTLVLKECTRLKQLPTIEQLEHLEVMDLSGCESLCDLPQDLSKQSRLKELNLRGCKGLTELTEGLFDQLSSLEKLDLSDTSIGNLPSFANLISGGTVINHSGGSVLESNTVQTELVNLCSDSVDSRPEFHLVSNFITNSGFDKFKYNFTEINHYFSSLEERFTKNIVVQEAEGIKMQFKRIRDDLEYILGKVDLLESSENFSSSERLLHELASYEYISYDYDNSSILKKLLRTVTKLKLLVPPLPPKPLSLMEVRTNLEPLSRHEKIGIMNRKKELIDDYESLTTIQKNCLLYFACITEAKSGNKESNFVHLLYAEGFLDSLLYANSTSNLMPRRNDANSTIVEIGQDVLRVLEKKRFIYRKGTDKKWYIKEPNSSFVITKAMEEPLFDFNKQGKLTPHFCASRRACLLKFSIKLQPSSRIWLNCTKSAEQLESFKTVRTLLNIDVPFLDINTEWFSYMTNLQVLHLANLNCESDPIKILDVMFLEELKRMKQLKLLNLEFHADIEKLPDSICQLTNLRILNLAYCSNLMGVPTGIATLTNLIILDLTQCLLLSHLPKGLASLLKLEVLKGFPITYEVSGRQSKKACTLRELLKLEGLTKLNLVVNRESFPDSIDIQVLRNMKELRNLKIEWKIEFEEGKYFGNAEEKDFGDAVEEAALRQSRWKQFRCWGSHNETEEEEELLLTNCSLEYLNKLVLCCFPYRSSPDWLNPTEFQKLERLYIVGGSLRTIIQESADKWKVKSLQLKHLHRLYIDWSIVKGNFPCVTSCKRLCCHYIQNFTGETMLEDLFT